MDENVTRVAKGTAVAALYLGRNYTGVLAGYSAWDYISLRNLLHQRNCETFWSFLTSYVLTVVWLLIPLFQCALAIHRDRLSQLLGFALLSLSGPVLLVLTSFGSLSGVEPLLNWCPLSSFCWDENIYPFMELLVWDFLFLISVLCSYLWYRSTANWYRRRQARLAYLQVRDQLLTAIERESVTSEHGSVCAICLDEFRRNDELRRIPRCRHHFHTSCIDRWFQNNMICPICRQPVF